MKYLTLLISLLSTFAVYSMIQTNREFNHDPKMLSLPAELRPGIMDEKFFGVMVVFFSVLAISMMVLTLLPKKRTV